jgi:Peptidase family M23
MRKLATAVVMATAVLVGAARTANAEEIEAVLAHPIYAGFYVCSEHVQGQFDSLGDALGTDCLAAKLVNENDRTWLRTYRGQGLRNEDWFSWRAQVLSPCDCVVTGLSLNKVTNEPGRMGTPPASMIRLTRDDGVTFVLAHIQEPGVKMGDRVTAGQAIARAGNNGYARNPHVHVGAWRDRTPLQIRWDQRFMTVDMD